MDGFQSFNMFQYVSDPKDQLNNPYPLVICYIAIENGPVEIVDFPINSMVDLSIVFCMFTRGYIYTSSHGLVGNFHIIGTIEMGCLILGVVNQLNNPIFSLGPLLHCSPTGVDFDLNVDRCPWALAASWCRRKLRSDGRWCIKCTRPGYD